MLTAGSGQVDLMAANDPKLFTDPVSLSYSDLNVNRGAARSRCCSLADAGEGSGTWTIEVKPQVQPSGVRSASRRGHDRSRRSADPGHGERVGGRGRRRGLRLPAPPPRLGHPQGRVRPARDAPGLAAHRWCRCSRSRQVTRAGRLARPPTDTRPPPRARAELHRRARERGRRRDALPDPARRAGGERRRRVIVHAGLARPSLVPRLGGRERRPGLRGLPVNVNNLTSRLPARHRRRRHRLPADEGVLRRRRLRPRPFTGRSLGGAYVLRAWIDDVQPPLLGLPDRRPRAGRRFAPVSSTSAPASTRTRS